MQKAKSLPYSANVTSDLCKNICHCRMGNVSPSRIQSPQSYVNSFKYVTVFVTAIRLSAVTFSSIFNLWDIPCFRTHTIRALKSACLPRYTIVFLPISRIFTQFSCSADLQLISDNGYIVSVRNYHFFTITPHFLNAHCVSTAGLIVHTIIIMEYSMKYPRTSAYNNSLNRRSA